MYLRLQHIVVAFFSFTQILIMKIKQFEYKPLSHFSYAIISEGKMAIIDPERNPIKYYKLAEDNNAKIVAVFETHPHADFISSHLQIHKETGATIYCSEKTGADYPHKTFDEGDKISIGKVNMSPINTPGHSPDSITIVAKYESDLVLFTGDTLFIGDIGRPDLRETSGNFKAKRRELAEDMYYTIQNKFKHFPDSALIYPAHGAGSLCGKSMSDDKTSTLGNERVNNWAFKEQSKQDFIDELLNNQPFIPSYFSYDVEINKAGADNYRSCVADIIFRHMSKFEEEIIIDTRSESRFKDGHLPGSFNIQANSENSKFETWLGAIVLPNEEFSIVIDSADQQEYILERISKIGYEKNVISLMTIGPDQLIKSDRLDLEEFKQNPRNYTIVDVRNKSEIEEGKVFENALSHPLNDLRQSYKKIPTDKPIVVHCAGGYRSAAGSSILQSKFKDRKIFDLGEDIKKFID